MSVSIPPSFSSRILASLASHRLIEIVSSIHEYRGKQQLYEQRKPEVLERLRSLAMIQSVESSNRLEKIYVSRKILKDIVLQGKAVEENERSQGEIAGYKDVLSQIHENHKYIPWSNNIVKQFHRDLMSYVADKGAGEWKNTPNDIIETLPNGERFVRFSPPGPRETPLRMEALLLAYTAEINKGEIAQLILMALYVLDFLCVHPFADGNGRMVRLLTVLLLYHQGYKVGRYISLERIVEDNSKGYYDTLFEASQGWHEGKHDPRVWVEYWLEVMVLGAYKKWDTRFRNYEIGYGAKKGLVGDAFRGLPVRFKISDLRELCPSVSDDTVRSFLVEMGGQGKVRCLGKGRHAVWEKSG